MNFVFPDDWSKLSDEQVSENIQYLSKNYKKYRISILDDKTIRIGNVVICRTLKNIQGQQKTCLDINGKIYCRESAIGKEIIDLVHVVKMYALPVKQKAKNLWNKNKSDVKTFLLGGVAVAVLFIGTYVIAIIADKSSEKSAIQKQEQLDKHIDERIKSAIREYDSIKTIQCKDSLKLR